LEGHKRQGSLIHGLPGSATMSLQNNLFASGGPAVSKGPLILN